MTVTAAEARIEYAGNASTTVFTYPYQFFQADDLDVWLFDDTTGDGVQQVLNTNYTVSGAMSPTGGNVTFMVAPPAGHTVIIINSPDIVQTLHYVNADDFPADSHEQGLDRLTKICQRLSDRIDRSVRAPDYAPEDDVPDADTLVDLVNQAKAAADSAQSSEEDAGNYASASQNSANAALTAQNNAQSSASAAASSATAAANSATAAQVAKIVWRGPYAAGTTYAKNDAVQEAGSSWVSRSDGNTGHTPSGSIGTFWDLMAQKGVDGSGGAGGGDMLGSANLAQGPGGVANSALARTNLGLKGAAVLDVGTTAGTVAAGDDARLLAVANKADLASPAFSGNPTAPTPPANDNDTSIATTAFVQGAVPAPATANPLQAGTAAPGTSLKFAREDHIHPVDVTRAPINSPGFTGNPTAPTPSPGDNDTSIATTAFVTAAIAASGLPLSQRVGTFANEDYAVTPTALPFTTVIMQDGSMRTAGNPTAGNPDYANPSWGGTTLADLRRVTLPAGLLGTPQKIVQNYLSTFVITDQGDVCCCGYNNGGELGLGNQVATATLTLLPATNIGPRSAGGVSRRIVEIAVARSVDSNTTTQLTTLFRCADGTLWAAGYNQVGSCAQGNTTTPQSTLVQCKKTGSVLVTDAAKLCVDTGSTNGCSCAYIDTSGKVWLCGALNNGSWGRNTTTGSQTLFNQPMTTSDIGTSDLPPAYVATDVQFMTFQTTYVLCADKNVYAFGFGTSGNIGNGASVQVSVPKKVGGAVAGTVQGNIERMFALNFRNDAQNNAVMIQLTSGACYFWGNCANNATACTATGIQNSPQVGLGRLAAGCPVVNRIIAGQSASTSPQACIIALLADGTAYCWGSGRTDFSGSAITSSSTPIQVVIPTRPGNPAVAKIAGGSYYNASGTGAAYSFLAVTWADGSVMGSSFWSYPCGPGGIAVPNTAFADWAFIVR